MSSKEHPPSRIPLSVPSVGEGELENLRSCIETSWVSSAGPYVREFENRLAELAGTKNAVATASGTSALHLSLIVAGVKRDEEVLVSTLSFIAPANAVAYTGAVPVFVDADPKTWQMCPVLVEKFLREDCKIRNGDVFNKKSGRKISAILPVHILGGVVEMAPLLALAKEFNLPIIEDATEGLGAIYQGKPVGTIGEVGCYSFNGNKLITCGGGGMIVSDHSRWAKRARHLSTQAKSDPAEYIHDEIGFNYRLTNLQAALGCAQLDKFERYVLRKKEIASAYKSLCNEIDGLNFMPDPEWSESVFWLSAIAIDPHGFGMGSRSLLKKAGEQGIEMRPLWQPLHLSPAYKGSMMLGGSVAEDLFKKVLCVPSSVDLDNENLERVLTFIKESSQSK
ncbi:MAG: LegC family aminotransferase [Rhodospirillales bacterium]|nr:LegC family aminotransferase [Rhodospirillales bacterium]